MLTFSDEIIRGKIKTDLKQNADHIAFLPFNDLKQSVIDDIQILKDSPLVLDVPITGYVYEVETGKIVKIGSS
jgi:carbonic anhydrase